MTHAHKHSEEFDLDFFFKNLDCPFAGLKREWLVNQAFILHLLPSDFSSFTSRTFADLKKSSPAAKILHLLADVIEKNNAPIGFQDPKKTGNHFRYDENGIPKTVQVIEQLIGEKGGNDFKGFRIWIFVIDPQFDMGEGFLSHINRTNKSNWSSDYSKTKKPEEPAKYWEIKSVEKLADLWNEYLDTPARDSLNIDSLYTEEQGLGKSTSTIHPKNVLNVRNAFKMIPDDICECQKDIRSYFDTAEGIETAIQDSSSSKMFPLPNLVSRIEPLFFTPKYIDSIPLSNFYQPIVMQTAEEKRSFIEQRKTLENFLNNPILEDEERESAETKLRELMGEREDAKVRNRSRLKNLFGNKQNQQSMGTHAEVEDIFKGRNIFRQLEEENTKKKKAIREKHKPGTQSYIDAMNAFYDTALLAFYHAFCEGDKVTFAVKACRIWYSGLSPEENFVEHNIYEMALSLFGNIQARNLVEFEKVFKVKTNFRLAMEALLVTLGAHRYHYGLRANLLMTGDGATGKSWIINLIEKLAAPGTTMNITHQTTHAFNTNEDLSDIALFKEELNPQEFGIQPDMKEGMASPFLKNRLTGNKNVVHYFVYDKASSERLSKMSQSRSMGTHLFATNDHMPPDSTAIMQRFHHHVMKSGTRPDRYEGDSIYGKDQMDDTPATLKVILKYHLLHYYILLIEKAIESGALPDVDLEVVGELTKLVFDKLAKKGIKRPPQRQLGDIFHDLVRTQTLLYAIEAGLFSELGLDLRQKNGKACYFSPLMLKTLIKFFVPTEEIVVFCLTLLSDMWIPSIKENIIKAFADLVPHTKNERGEWCPKFKVSETDMSKVTSFRDDAESASAGEAFQYVCLRDTRLKTIKDIALALVNKIPSPPSCNDTIAILHQMKGEFIKVYPKTFSDVEKVLSSDTSGEKKEIPIITLEKNMNSRDGYTLSIAIDALNRKFDDILHEAIKNGLENSASPNRTYITATTHQEKEGTKNVPYYQIYRLLSLNQKNGRTIVHANTQAYTGFEQGILNNKLDGQLRESNSSGRQDTHIVNLPIDYSYLHRYWIQSGLQIEKAKVAYPPITIQRIKQLREHRRYVNVNKNLGDRYPQIYIQEIKQRKEAKRKLKESLLEGGNCDDLTGFAESLLEGGNCDDLIRKEDLNQLFKVDWDSLHCNFDPAVDPDFLNDNPAPKKRRRERRRTPTPLEEYEQDENMPNSQPQSISLTTSMQPANVDVLTHNLFYDR